MKQIITTLLLFCIIGVYGQMPTNGNYANWDWENQSQDNWKMKQGTKWTDIRPPFLISTDKSAHLENIYRTQDYTYQNGWRLVHAQFDGAYPYFLLYNVYKSVLRSFVYTGSTVTYNAVLTVLTPSEKLKESKILNASAVYQSAIENKQKQDIANISVLDSRAGLESWSVADFLMSFDNTITASDFANQKWSIAFYTSNKMDVKLSIKGTSTPVPVDQLTTFVGGENSISSGGFNTSYSRVNNLVQSGEAYFEKMQSSANKIKDGAWKPLQTYKGTVDKLSKVGGYLSAAASASSALGVLASFVDIFQGGLGASSVPMGYTHNLDATGTITFQQKMRETQFQVPGVQYSYNGRPDGVFSCPMGIINLSKEPIIKKTTPYLRLGNESKIFKPKTTGGFGFARTKYEFGTNLFKPAVFPEVAFFSQSHIKEVQTVKYSLENSFDFVTQELAGLKISKIKLAIVCKPNNYSIGTKSYDQISLVNANQSPPKFLANNSFERFRYYSGLPVPIENPVYYALESGKFIIHKYGDNDSDVYFGTPYTSIDSLQKVTFEVPQNTDVMLGVLVTYYAPNSKEPQIFKALYKFKELEEKAQKAELFFDDVYQPNFGDSGGAYLKNTVSKVNFACSSPKPQARLFRDLGFEPNIKVDFKTYSTPTDGILYVEPSDVAVSYDIAIYNMQGKLIVSKLQLFGNTSIDIYSYAKGTYIVQIVSKQGVKQEKILVK